jgi:hypothetical protein
MSLKPLSFQGLRASTAARLYVGHDSGCPCCEFEWNQGIPNVEEHSAFNTCGAIRPWLMAGAVALAGCSGENPSGPTFGSLVVTIGGLPTGANAGVTVTGPGTFSRVVTATTTLTSLPAGTYTIAVANVTHDGAIYSGSPTTQSVAVSAGATVTAPGVSYTLASGSLSVTFSGLPQATPAPIVISGPDGYSRTISEPTSITALKPGAYSIEAREVQLTNGRYAGTPATQQVDVLASLTAAQVHVSYAITSGSMALAISGLPPGAPGAVTITGPGATPARLPPRRRSTT